MPDPAIEVSHLRKVFQVVRKAPGLAGALRGLFVARREEVVAVDGLDLRVEPGELVGYIGVNGAGKSTTIKLLTGILAPTSGTIRVLGRDPQRQRIANAADIGVVFGQRSQLWWDLPLVESLDLVARIHDVPAPARRERLDRFSEMLELGPLLPVPVRQLSLGQKMRAELAAALLHHPRVVYLDEPTIGLDVVVKDRIRAFVREQNREAGTTVVLTTHDLSDIEELCRRVVLIDRGRVIHDGTLEAIHERFGQERELTLELARPAPSDLRLLPGVERVEAVERRLVLRFDRRATSAAQLSAAVMAQVEVKDFSLREPDLAAVVKRLHAGGAAP